MLDLQIDLDDIDPRDTPIDSGSLDRTDRELKQRLGRRAALEESLRSAIRTGRLDAGSTVPSTRALAADLGLSRSTVVAAYEQLTAEGYLHAAHGSATTVASSPTIRALLDDERAQGDQPTDGAATDGDEIGVFHSTPRHDFRPGEPDSGSFPRTRWMRSIRRVLGETPDSALGYPDPRGVTELRTAVAGHLGRTRTVHAERSGVHIVGGYGAGLGFIAETLRRRGVERIAVEDPTLPLYTSGLRSAGLHTVPVAIDAGGIDIERLRAADVGAVVVTPAHQYPTGITMSASRRMELIDWARSRDAWIIEDDYDGEFRYDRRPVGSLQGLDPERVVYAGTVSKSLSPALRLGWLVVPEVLRSDLLRIVGVRAGVSGIDQLALADFIERGELDRHLRSMRKVYRRRNLALREVLADYSEWLEVGDSSAGLHLIAHLRSDRIDEAAVLAAAEPASVGLAGLITHHRSSAAGPGFAVGFSRPPEHHFPTALERLGDVLGGLG